MIISNPIIEKATAIYKPEKDITEISILWSNSINSNEETYVKIDLEAGTYGCTLIEHNNITDTDKSLLYHKEQTLHGRPANEIVLRTYNSFGLNHEIRVPIISVRGV